MIVSATPGLGSFDIINDQMDAPQSEGVIISVGDKHFPMTNDIINKYVDSYFAKMLHGPWRDIQDRHVTIERDVNMFHYIHGFMLDDTFMNVIESNLSLSALLDLKCEADYFNLQTLIRNCDQQALLKLQDWCKSVFSDVEMLRLIVENEHCELREAIQPWLYRVCLRGKLVFEQEENMRILEKSTLARQDLSELHQYANRNFYNLADRGSPFLAQDPTIQQILNTIPSLPGLQSFPDKPFLRVLEKDYFTLASMERRYEPCSIGMAYYILHPAEQGGEVVVSTNGVQYKIQERGEYIVALFGYSIQFEKVLSGALGVLCSTIIVREDCSTSCTTDYPSLPSLTTPHDLVTLLHRYLHMYDRIVVGLPNYYPIQEFDLYTWCGEGNPDMLRAADAALFKSLVGTFHVIVVTVYITRENDKCMAAVLDPSINKLNLKFVVPPLGYGQVSLLESGSSTLCSALCVMLK